MTISNPQVAIDFVSAVGSMVGLVDHESFEAACDAMAKDGYLDALLKKERKRVRFFRASCIAMGNNVPEAPAEIETPPPGKRIIMPSAH